MPDSPDLKCTKKVLGNAMKISQATPAQLKEIQKCSILASGGKPNPKIFGKPRGYKQTNNLTKTTIADKKKTSKKL